MKYVLQDMDITKRYEAPVFVANDELQAEGKVVTRHSQKAKRYERDQAIDVQNRSRGRYRALPEIAPIVEANS